MSLIYDENVGKEDNLLKRVETQTWPGNNGYFGIEMSINGRRILDYGGFVLNLFLLKINNAFYQLIRNEDAQASFEIRGFSFLFHRQNKTLFLSVQEAYPFKGRGPITSEETDFYQAVAEVIKAVKYYRKVIFEGLAIALPNKIEEGVGLLIKKEEWAPLEDIWDAICTERFQLIPISKIPAIFNPFEPGKKNTGTIGNYRWYLYQFSFKENITPEFVRTHEEFRNGLDYRHSGKSVVFSYAEFRKIALRHYSGWSRCVSDMHRPTAKKYLNNLLHAFLACPPEKALYIHFLGYNTPIKRHLFHILRTAIGDTKIGIFDFENHEYFELSLGGTSSE